MDNSQETPPNFIQTRLAVALAGALQSEWNAKEWHILHKFDELQSSVSSGTPSDRQDLLDRMADLRSFQIAISPLLDDEPFIPISETTFESYQKAITTDGEDTAAYLKLMEQLFHMPTKGDRNPSSTGSTNVQQSDTEQQGISPVLGLVVPTTAPGDDILIRHALEHQWDYQSVKFVVFLHEISERWREFCNPEDVVGILHEVDKIITLQKAIENHTGERWMVEVREHEIDTWMTCFWKIGHRGRAQRSLCASLFEAFAEFRRDCAIRTD